MPPMEDEAFYAQAPKDRDYRRWLLGQLSFRWFLHQGMDNVAPAAKPLAAAAFVIIYPFWVVIILAMLAGYFLLWLALMPVRNWAKKNKKGYYAEDSPPPPPPLDKPA
jgi:hypothetical protein